MSRTVLTGIKPTGIPHIGNLLGAIRPALDMVNLPQFKDSRFIFFIADYHALTTLKDPKQFNAYVYDVAATWLSFGLDPKKVIFYRQSDIPEIFELSWLLACHTPKGDMNRAHAYKALIQQNEEKNAKDPDHGINMGIFTYPVLMAADILLFDTNIVPVGKDQVQHVEIARSIAQRVNQYYGPTLIEPQEWVRQNSATIPGLDGRKMSKSYNNTIPLFVPEKTLQKMINRIKTDSTPPEAPKNPDDSLIFDLYQAFSTEEKTSIMRNRFLEGISWGEAKAQLFEVMNEYLKEPREKYLSIVEDKAYIEQQLKEGAEKAREIASATISRFKKVFYPG